MNPKQILITVLLTAGVFFISCEKAAQKPEVTITELGYENSKIGYTGTDLHIEADVVAEGKIDYITIEIHHEGDHAEKAVIATKDEGEWDVDTTYTEFSGLKNTTFHKHIAIPVDAEVGDYHFHFIVTDMEGQQTIVEEELEVQYPDDAVAPEMNITGAPDANQEFNNGESITISGSVSDDQALGGMYIGLVRVDNPIIINN